MAALKEMELTQEGDVWTLFLKGSPNAKGGFENRFNPEFCAEFHKALDTVCATKGPCALVITSEGRFFSNGLDVKFMMSKPDGMDEAMNTFNGICGRLLTLPVVTVAAVNGHAYAGGFLLALACDYRGAHTGGQRLDLCMNEVEMGVPLDKGSPPKPPPLFPAMNALLQAKLGAHTTVMRDTFLRARRWTPQEGKDHGFLDFVASSEQEAHQQAKDLAKKHSIRSKDRETYQILKQTMFKEAALAFADGTAAAKDLGAIVARLATAKM